MEVTLKEYLESKTGIIFTNDNYDYRINYVDEIFDELYSGCETFAYLSKEVFNNSDFDYQICISIIDGWQIDLNDMNLISVSIAKTKTFHSDDKINSVLSSTDLTFDELNTYDICEYGLCANIVNMEIPKTDTKEVLNYIAKCIPVFNGLLGFYLDKPQNRIGNTGWDFINGTIGF